MNLDFLLNLMQKPMVNMKLKMKLTKISVRVKVKFQKFQKPLKKRRMNKILNEDSHYYRMNNGWLLIMVTHQGGKKVYDFL